VLVPNDAALDMLLLMVLPHAIADPVGGVPNNVIPKTSSKASDIVLAQKPCLGSKCN
jgi:hypothetical protein